ncbi:MAG: CpaF/VirB11 family protein, partial [Flavobacteriaceae bacterium]|nr:CpaF/VirB11 family protein [Flavobacteriaceae bacterium]
VGINASIRIINPKKLRKNDFVSNQTITETMFNFLTDVLSYGSSVLFAGDTGSGKTTILGGILYDLIEKHPNKRIITIEQDMREFDLDQYNEEKEKISNVIYLKTRMSKEGQVIDNITQERLLQVSLTMNPDIITVGEMKSAEANSAQEAARTGHSVTGTIHSNSCRATYSRICTLCQMKYNLDYNILYNLVTEAFPVIVYCEKLADNKTRKIMEITECVIDEQGNRTINTLFRYDIEKYIKNDKGEIIDITGKFVKVHPISENLRNLFYKKGISEERLKAYLEV